MRSYQLASIVSAFEIRQYAVLETSGLIDKNGLSLSKRMPDVDKIPWMSFSEFVTIFAEHRNANVDYSSASASGPMRQSRTTLNDVNVSIIMNGIYCSIGSDRILSFFIESPCTGYNVANNI